ncbi:hypothetical protein [Methylobacterium tardum]|uniref:Uncharacterized protein n=1 Tax=Methylobacterium tardum TaxID=374432 RepID=A0AA37WRH6_9HYPH|nr:hypothetical protein [Methylobacterium tardum]URD37897.1 hypothetical protein M6G65_05120 [Methylobacterium tardum]GLS68083.1 hypothetical protein GCM10007890_00940 [Methylobacterium tardum]
MEDDSTLAKALVDVRRQRATLEAKFEQLSAELSKLRLAERSLAAIVEGATMDEPVADPSSRRRSPSGDDQPRSGRATGRGSRGPRANSAKGRLKTLLEDAGIQGLSHAQISDRLHAVAPNTLATYLSVMTTSGELERHGDLYRAAAPAADVEEQTSDEVATDAVMHDRA